MLAVIGGSGFYELLTDAREECVGTPYGDPSDKIMIGKINGKDIAFLPRHGKGHKYPPHKIPYKANIWALKELGVKHIIAPAAVGSLKANIAPGEFLIPDQFVNFTRREDTCYEGNSPVTHISTADPYCEHLRKIIIDNKNQLGSVHEKGTVIVIQGPRFSTKAESSMFSQIGDIINMTQYPEVVLARELELCYASICVITDYDSGLKENPNINSVTLDEVVRVFKENNEKLKRFLVSIASKIPEERTCECASALKGARF
ncbi:MAG: S-methyl-5'-thioadenosine phosphorylase [Candidatus Aenigmarchaeota archaeon]|nr:S-methyl-5'-thioadenosine phosphorylase [Candidatus Aenigmarchaeota archaeon]